jgi:hypothetical protein
VFEGRLNRQSTRAGLFRAWALSASTPLSVLTTEGEVMALFIVLLILALIVFGVGFAVHLLWWLLIVLLVIAVISWLFGRRRA